MPLYKRSGQLAQIRASREPPILVIFLVRFGCIIFALLALGLSKMVISMISKIIFAITSLGFGGILWVLNSTTPASIGPVGVFGLFFLEYVFFVGAISFLSSGVFRLIKIFLGYFNIEHRLKERDFKFFLRNGFVLAFIPVILIIQQSAGGIDIFGLILLAIFQILSFVIILKR